MRDETTVQVDQPESCRNLMHVARGGVGGNLKDLVFRHGNPFSSDRSEAQEVNDGDIPYALGRLEVEVVTLQDLNDLPRVGAVFFLGLVEDSDVIQVREAE